MKKNCSSCGKENQEHAAFCESCGNELKKQSSFFPYLIGTGSALVVLFVLYNILVSVF